MALQSSGQISMNEMHIEAGGTSATQVGMNDSDMRALAGVPSGQITANDFYGKSSAFTATVTSASTPYQVGFTEQGAKSQTYSRSVNPSSDVGSVTQGGGYLIAIVLHG